ncbi:response regulator transcription factor [uncultured Meiothermus sp.]|jgi:DNA-binding NarL/FixJ family response regulator|uniref:response regulator n=1 Tax=uncultured Meiothermus sp. TaxID=157471 RepID=UPI002615C5B1|nr:response regulator transcription factor [uncultured Meiothermus sp.]
MKVVLIEDHALIRTGLRLVLESADHLVEAEFDRAEDALARLSDIPTSDLPDLVVLDLNLAGMPGIQALPKLRDFARVLVLSMHEETEYIAEAFARGASGYLPKRAVDRDLLDAVAAIARGERYLHPLLAPRLAEHVSQPTPEMLSQRERAVVALLAQGYNLSQAAEKLSISVKTAATYKSRALDKLGLDSQPELVQWARNHGLV